MNAPAALLMFLTDVCDLQVCRGTAVMMVSPTAGTEELAQNPFLQSDGPA